MSIKKLFDKSRTSKVVSSTDIENLKEGIESAENIKERFEDVDRFVPQIDFTNPENFARFASAEKYYSDAMDRIVRNYPYDGSESELNEYNNESNYIDKYIFDNLYPRTTGYAKFGRWGDTDTAPAAANLYYGESTAKEYIEARGGPHTASYGMPSGFLGATFTGSNYYSTDIYNQSGVSPVGRDGTRESNLRMNLDDGITVEFWLKKEQFIASKTQKEVVFDLWNQVTSSSPQYGRFRVELTASGYAEDGADPFMLTFLSGGVVQDAPNGAGFERVRLGGSTVTTASVADNKWHHYAFSVVNDRAVENGTVVRFYRDGNLVSTTTTGSVSEEVTGSLVGFIGALQTPPSSSAKPADNMVGWGKLSGSVDDFRYWKARRTGKQISENYFTQVRGGTNTGVANTELGLYYKFNEGITGDSTTDSTVLDYSGRISNGIWTGYSGTKSRSTGSAILEYSGSNKVEYKDPIIYPTHPEVQSLRTALITSASYHDIRNNTSIYHSMPSWIIEDDDENAGQLKNLTQAIGNYFDTLYLQIEAMKDIHVPTYQTSSGKALPFANRLLESKGFINSEIFANADVLEAIMNRDTEREFSDDLHNVKNLIYQNIYNNLVHIFKTKGTEKSFKNLIRSFGVDEELIRINLYADNTTQLLRDNFRPKAVKKNFIDFYQTDNQDAVVTHQTSSQAGGAKNSDSIGVTYLSASHKDLATTAETEVIFPRLLDPGDPGYVELSFVSSSIFGWDQANPDPDNYAKPANGSGYQVLAVRPDFESKDAWFYLIDRSNNATVATSSLYKGVYDDQRWTFALRTRNAMTSSVTSTPSTPNVSHGMGTFLTGAAGIRAKAIDCIDLAGVEASSADASFTILIPIAAGGEHDSTAVTILLDDSETTNPADAANTIAIGTAGISDAAKTTALIDAINGTSSSLVDLASSGVGQAGVQGVTAKAGSTNTKITLSIDLAGAVGNLTNAITTASGVDVVDARSFAGGVDGTHIEVSLYGVHTAYDRIQEEFALSGNAIHSDITVPRRYYVGARRTNVIDSTVNEKSNVKVGYLRHWQMYLKNKSIQAHSRDTENYGTSNPMRNAYLLENALTGVWVPEHKTLALNWDFSNVTGSDADGEFVVQDFSSGSLLNRRFRDPDFDPIVNNQYNGRGYFFKTNTTAAVDTNYISSARYRLPEVMNSHDMIEIRNQDDLVFTKESRPISHYFAFEKSMYQTISEEMINMFAGITEFNNLIGEPVNKYRHEYKDMSKLRQIFYEKVENKPDLDKYLSYYKWLDTALGEMLQQLVPASSRFSDDIRNVVEDTVLTRNKYRHILPTLRTPNIEIEGQVKGIYENIYNWRIGHAPLPDTAATATWTFTDKGNEETTITLTDSNNNSVVFEVDQAGNGLADGDSGNTLLTGFANSAAGMAGAVIAAVNASVLNITATTGGGATGEVLLTQDAKGEKGNTAITLSNYSNWNANTTAVFPTSFAGGTTAQSKNCLWWKQRAERGGLTISSNTAAGPKAEIAAQVAIINEQRDIYKRKGYSFVSASVPQFTALQGTDGVTKVGVNNIPLYDGSYYPNNRFSRVYRLFVGTGFESKSILGAWGAHILAGQNPPGGPNTKYTYFRGVIDPANENKYIEVTNFVDESGCENIESLPVGGAYPSKTNREGSTSVSAKSTSSPTNKSNNLPFSLYKSDVSTGYKSSISNVNIALNTGTTAAGGLEINNLHHDVIETGEASMQGVFTEKFVGGLAHRHVDLNTTLDNPTNRVEGFVIVPSADSIQVRAPLAASDNRGASNPEVRADHYRNVKTKRPVNLRNIRQLTGSSQLNHVGNFTSFREVIQISDRDANNRAFVKHEGKGPFSENLKAKRKGRGNLAEHATRAFAGLGEFKDVAKPNFYISGSSHRDNKVVQLGSNQFDHNNRTDYTIIERFSAPGGPETAGDSLGGAALDFGSAQYSPYNNINYRNLSVRLPLQRLLTDHANQFGYKSDERHRATSAHIESSAGNSYTGENTLASATITVADGDAANGMTEGEKITITSAAGRTRTFRICEDNTSTAQTGDVLLDGTDTGAGTTADDGDIAVSIGIQTAAAATATWTFTDKGNEETTITLTDYEGTSVVFEVDQAGDGLADASSGNTLLTGFANSAAGMAGAVIAAVNASSLKITASVGDGATGEVLLTQDATVFAGNTTITLSDYSNWNANTSATFPTAFTGGQTMDTQNAFLVQLAGAITGSFGEGITVGEVPAEANGAQSFTTTQRTPGVAGNTSITTDISQLTIDGFKNGAATIPAFHNVNRNSVLRYELSSSRTATDAVIRKQTHDNYYVQREIPQSDTQYAWITGSLTHIPGHQTTVLGHPNPDGMVSSSVAFNYGLAQGPNTGIANTAKSIGPGFIPALNFVSASDVVSKFGTGAQYWIGPGELGSHPSQPTRAGGDKRINNTTYPNGFFPTDFVGMNGNVRQIIHTASLTLTGALNVNNTFLQNESTTTAPFYRATRLYLNQVEAYNGAGKFLSAGSEAMLGDTTVLNALNLNRNGPYGYPSFKQIRTGETRIGRYLRRNNIISYNETPGRHLVSEDPELGRTEKIERFGALKQFHEPVVVSKYKPAEFTLAMKSTYDDAGSKVTNTRPVKLRATVGNELNFFSDPELDNEKGFIKSPPVGYTTITDFYLRGGLASPSTPIESFIDFTYKESVYPKEVNTYMQKSRARNSFTNNFWKDAENERRDLGQDKLSFAGITANDPDPITGEALIGAHTKRSSWNLDGLFSFTQTGSATFAGTPTGETGILQEQTAIIHHGSKNLLTASCFYARPHMLGATSSVRSLTGPEVPETGSTNEGLGVHIFGKMKIYGGITAWEAGAQAGVINDNGVFVNQSTTPFYNTYEDYSDDIRAIAKDYSVIPEFRISEHIDFYVNKKQGNFLAPNPKLLSIEGSPTGSSIPQNSSEDEFYKIYSTSDFMKHFGAVKTEHKELVNPSEITLTCKAAMKFLPYNGFYPSERTVEIAQQFSSSYMSQCVFAGDDKTFKFAKIRPLIAPLFAPGVLYNTIKSGIAVDYPVYTGSFKRHNPKNETAKGESADAQHGIQTELYMIATASVPRLDGNGKLAGWDLRVPFESLVEPEKYMANVPFVDMEVHPSSAMDLTASWSGQGDNLYKMMSNNFLAAVPEFFLPSGEFATLKSKPQKQFEALDTGSIYGMRIRLRKSYNRGRQESALNSYFVPHDIFSDAVNNTNPLRETFTMYSRPSAFGPPVSGRHHISGSVQYQRRNISDSLLGVNPSFTPPYYDGEAWCDVVYQPSSSFVTLGDILADSHKFYWRFDKLDLGNASNNTHPYGNININKFSMQLSSSFNLFQKVIDPAPVFDKDGNVISVSQADDQNTRWVIQPKFETPMYNFADSGVHPITNAAGTLRVPIPNSESIARGMWHQFGVIPKDTSRGIFLEVDSIPKDFVTNRVPRYQSASYAAHTIDINAGKFDDTSIKGAYGGGKHEIKSLLDVVTFENTSVKLGETAAKKTFSEAVVAVPFIEEAGQRKFFNIDRDVIRDAITNPNTTEAGDSIKKMVRSAQKFVLPPTMDFITYQNEIDPITMYFFEFEFEFDQVDLQHIWQNLMPPSGKTVKIKQSTINHKFLLNELLGNVASETGEPINDKLKWMVFKVKQKANTNYFSKIAGFDQEADTRYAASFKAGRTGPDSDEGMRYSYNWPFDFFSMVELVKLESEIKFAANDKDIDSKLVIESEKDILDKGVVANPELEEGPQLIPREAPIVPQVATVVVSNNITQTKGKK